MIETIILTTLSGQEVITNDLLHSLMLGTATGAPPLFLTGVIGGAVNAVSILFGSEPASSLLIVLMLFVMLLTMFFVGIPMFFWMRSQKRKSDIANLFKKIRNGKDKRGDLHQVCVINFLGQLEWDEYPQSSIKDIMNRVDEQRKYILKEFDVTLLSVLNERIRNGDMDATVLLGQYYYDRPQADLNEEVIVAKLVDEVCGGVGAENKISKNQIKSGHQIASHLFKQAFEKDSILSMYYLVKLWEEDIIGSPNPNELSEIMENKRMSGEIHTTDCANDEKIAVRFVQSAIKLADSEYARQALAKANMALDKEKKQTEELMQWIAHSTNSDLTSLELSVKREHAANSQVLTQQIRHDVETFALMSSDSDAFVNAVKQDAVGSITLRDVLCESIISTMLFMLSPKARDQKLMNHRYFYYAQHTMGATDISRKSWVRSAAFPALQKKLFTEFLSIKDDTDKALRWIREHFGEMQLNIDDSVQLTMSEHGKKSVVLAYIFKQFINNAIKYGSEDSMFSITCTNNADWYNLTSANKVSSRQMQKGNNQGLNAMDMMLSKLRQPKLDKSSDDGIFTITCKLERDLMGG